MTTHTHSTDNALRLLVAEQLLAALSGADPAEQEWARSIFVAQGFLAEAIDKLRSADDALERAAAARTLGIARSQLATPHLVAGMFDKATEVSHAAAEALARIDDPAIAIDPLNLLWGNQEPFGELANELAQAAGPETQQSNKTKQPPDGTNHPGFANAEKPSYRPDPSDVAFDVFDFVAELAHESPQKRIDALDRLARSRDSQAFELITSAFDDLCPDVRKAAAHALYELDAESAAQSFARAVDEGTPDRRRNIGVALHASGLAQRAIDDLVGDSRTAAYNALCLLFVMAKTGEIEPLLQAIEGHTSVEVRCAAVRLLTLNGQSEAAAEAAKRRLNVQG